VTAQTLAPSEGHDQQAADTFGELIDEKSAEQFIEELDEYFEQHSSVMMALFRQFEKAGIRRPPAANLPFERIPAFTKSS